ncbi:hypothetical protein [Hymenobacter defluvii]|uniref:PD-(D/E)XK endonuclease-like domain-containing protein n=1 Tax=Hymenobacter defluvii TaxID=2054411 RepID=A0ABS3TH42_9BACT|nr:hypothetical protein [Hymenobacter defluvii]MBO3272982.1 hypothetical protein [Hymenobacter defluvii]
MEKRLEINPASTATTKALRTPATSTAVGHTTGSKSASGKNQTGAGAGNTPIAPLPEVEKVSSTAKFIGYQPSALVDTGAFPLVRMPKAGCVIKFPRVGRSGRRGYKEADFMQVASRLLSNGSVKVYNDRHVPTPNAQSPYEPDLVLLNEANGLNLFLNIEIDEPYDGIHRQPIHCQGEDDARDEFFTRRGWIVVRFAEIQVHQQPEACCAYVAALISRLDPSYEIPAVLRSLQLKPEQYWDVVQAQKWQKQRYREQYLGITNFGRREQMEGWQAPAALAVEAEIEKLVDQSALLLVHNRAAGRLEKNHSHKRDASLQFDPEAHQYFINGQPATAVSTLVDRFFPEFDKHYWAPRTASKRGMTTEEILLEWEAKGKTSAALGTQLHEHIEEFYNNGATHFKTTEFRQFLDFHADHGHLTPHRTEWRVFNEELMIAGTVDFVAQHADGSVSIYDWKRSEKVIYPDSSIQRNVYQTNEGPLNDLDDCRFNRYSIQQNLYKWLLESEYGCRVRSMHLVVLHPAYGGYTVLDVPDRTPQVQKIVESLRSYC